MVSRLADVAVEIRGPALSSGRSSLTALTLDRTQSFDRTTSCDLFTLSLQFSLIITLRESSDEIDDSGSAVGGEESSALNVFPDFISCCWLFTDDFSISASRSMIRSPIPTSHSLSSYSKLESLLISLDVDVDKVDVLGSVDT